MGNEYRAEISWIILLPHIILCFLVVGMFTIWKPLLAKLTTILSHDDIAVHGKTGIIKIQTLDSPIKQITSIKVEKGLFGSLLGYGTIYINTAAGNFTYNYIKNPEQFKNSILSRMN